MKLVTLRGLVAFSVTRMTRAPMGRLRFQLHVVSGGWRRGKKGQGAGEVLGLLEAGIARPLHVWYICQTAGRQPRSMQGLVHSLLGTCIGHHTSLLPSASQVITCHAGR